MKGVSFQPTQQSRFWLNRIHLASPSWILRSDLLVLKETGFSATAFPKIWSRFTIAQTTTLPFSLVTHTGKLDCFYLFFLNAVENANNVLVSMTKSISIINSLFYLPLFVILQQVDRYERDRRRDVHRLQIRGLGALVSVRKHSGLRRPNHLVLGASHPQQVHRECRQQTECKQFEGISNEVSSN